MSAQKPQLHASGLSMFSRCAEQFRRRYIEREVIAPAVAAVTGTAVDHAVTKNLAHKIETGALLPLEAVLDAARDGLVSEWDRQGVALTEDEISAGLGVVKGQATDKAIRLALTHATEIAPSVEPTHVQRSWSVELKNYPVDLAGTIDVQEGRAFVRDTKTSAKSPVATMAETSLQLTTYACAVKVIDGAPPVAVALDYLVDTKTPQAKTLVSSRNDDDFRSLLRRVEVVSKAIDAGVFAPANPDDWVCSPRFCGYYQTCPYVRRPVTVAAGGAHVHAGE